MLFIIVQSSLYLIPLITVFLGSFPSLPPQIRKTHHHIIQKPTDAQKSSSHLFFPNFNGSFDFDLPSKNAEEVRVSADGIATVIGVRDGRSTQNTRGNGGKK